MYFFRCLTVIILFLFCITLNAKEIPTYNSGKFIDEWLMIGPIGLKLPALVKDTASALKSFLSFENFDTDKIEPKEADEFNWDKTLQLKWKKMKSNFGEINFKADTNITSPQEVYLVTYLNADRWLKTKVEIKSCQPFELFFDGEMVASNATFNSNQNDTANCEIDKKTNELKIEKGKHTLILKSLKVKPDEVDWKIEASLIIDSTFNEQDIKSTISPTKTTAISNLLDDPKISSVSISPDGKLAAVQISQITNNGGSKDGWLEIFNTKNGSHYQTFKGGTNISSVSWYPNGEKFSYITTEKNKTTLWLDDLENGNVIKLLNDVENFGEYKWSPTGDFLIYSITQKPKENKTGLIKVNELEDRLPGSADKSFLYVLNYPDLTKYRLTAGPASTSINDISKDGKKILFTTSGYDYTKQPYSYSSYFILNLDNMKVDSLFTEFWSRTAQFSPDGSKILITGDQELFNNAAVTTSPNQIPNRYNTQAFIYDLTTKAVDPITKNFNPEIESAYWNSHDNNIYFRTRDKTYKNVYQFNTDSKQFNKINLPAEVITSIDFSLESSNAIFEGSSSTTPNMAYFVDLNNQKSKLIYNPNKESYKNIKLGKTEEWTFKNDRNENVDGLIYYPPDFDSSKTYPCIVNYYGGTLPIERNFEGRYPQNLWAANGYIVYILQPSGAVGYGQKFAAYHVNDWGEKTAEEIIEGTKEFLKSHTFVDSTKIGCIGASYGGFLTMNLLTKTNMFTTAIAHAGISSLAGYWGEGYWGYTYSAGATAGSFPWNRKDIYVDRSPLFNADKISTPILLLHGTADTNVPIGQSIQMFTALKLLGKKVDFIEIEGQNHHILDYKKRKLWTKTIIAWFDKYLKDQPEWYNDLYPKEE